MVNKINNNNSSNNSKGLALITGSAKNIGSNIAYNLAKIGYDIIIHYNNSEVQAKELIKKINKDFSVKTYSIKCDLNDKDQVKEMANYVANNHSNWNLLINNASIFKKSNFTNSTAIFYENFNIHFIAPLILSQEFYRVVKNKKNKNAQIINMLDKNLVRYETIHFYYLLTKKFLAEFTKMLSLETAPIVRVNGIAPGFLSHTNQEVFDIKKEVLIKKIPLKNVCKLEDIWQAVEFLVNNKFITGQIISIDGGASLNHAG